MGLAGHFSKSLLLCFSATNRILSCFRPGHLRKRPALGIMSSPKHISPTFAGSKEVTLSSLSKTRSWAPGLMRPQHDPDHSARGACTPAAPPSGLIQEEWNQILIVACSLPESWGLPTWCLFYNTQRYSQHPDCQDGRGPGGSAHRYSAEKEAELSVIWIHSQ